MSVATSAALLASLLITAVAPAAFASDHRRPAPATSRRARTSAGTATLIFTESRRTR